MIRTENLFFTKERFVSAAAWTDRSGTVLVLPALWLEWGAEIGLDVNLNRWTLGWLRWRVQVDFGRHRPRSARRALDWKADGLDEFLVWCKEVFGGVWKREPLERLLREDPQWYRLIALGGAPSYYTRVLIARELLRRASAPEGPVELDLPYAS